MLFEQGEHDITAAAQVCHRPYLHCVFEPDSIVTRTEVDVLLDTFPEDLMRAPALRTAGTDKNYLVSHLDVFDRGRWATPPDALPPPWRSLVRYLTGADYAAAIRRVLDLGDVPMAIEVRISRYPRGGWMSRHTDRPDKVFSHNVYLCPDWDPVWGGELALYDGADAHEPSRSVLPGAGNSVAFRRSDHSWHEVMPVAEDAGRPRCAVLVHGYHVHADEAIVPAAPHDEEANR